MKYLNRIKSFFQPKLSQQAFTLMEVLTVVVIAGAVAVLGVPRLGNVLEHNYCRTAQMNLVAIHSAVKIYHIRNRQYFSGAADLGNINTTFGLQIYDPKFTYTYTGVIADYTALATRTGGPNYNCSVSPRALNSNNPLCAPITFCPRLPSLGP